MVKEAVRLDVEREAARAFLPARVDDRAPMRVRRGGRTAHGLQLFDAGERAVPAAVLDDALGQARPVV